MRVIQCDVCSAILPMDDSDLWICEYKKPNSAFPHRIQKSVHLCRSCTEKDLEWKHIKIPIEEATAVSE